MTDYRRLELNVGTVPNDGQGEALRDAMIHINTNFQNLFEGTAQKPNGDPSLAPGVTSADLTAALEEYQKTNIVGGTAYLSANVAKLTANNAGYLGGVIATSYQKNTTLNTDIANYINSLDSGSRNVNVASLAARADSYFDKDVYIGGNLHINGETTFINTTVITTNDKQFILANNASSATAANQTGIIVAIYANLMYNDAKSSWQSNVNMTPATDGTLALGATDRKWNLYSNNINTTMMSASGNVMISTYLHTGDKYGNSTSGSLGGVSINSIVTAVGNSSVNSIVNAYGLTVKTGSNTVVINSSAIFAGNTTVNATLASNSLSLNYATGYFTIDSSMNVAGTGDWNLINKTIWIDSGSVRGYLDSTAGSMGGVAITNTGIGVGNSVAYSTLDSIGFNVNTYGSSAGGLKANAAGVYVGNSVSNSFVNSTMVGGPVVRAGNSTVYFDLTSSGLASVTPGFYGLAAGGSVVNSIGAFVGNNTSNTIIANSYVNAVSHYSGSYLYGAHSTFTGTGAATGSPGVNATAKTITITSNPFVVGEPILYRTDQTITAIGGLTNNTVYLVRTKSTDAITLATTAAPTVDIAVTASASATGHFLSSTTSGSVSNSTMKYWGSAAVNSTITASSIDIGNVSGATIFSSGFRANLTTILLGNTSSQLFANNTTLKTEKLIAGLAGTTYMQVDSGGMNLPTLTVNTTGYTIGPSGARTVSITGTVIDGPKYTIGSSANISTLGMFTAGATGFVAAGSETTGYGTSTGGFKANANFIGMGSTASGNSISVNTSSANVALVIGAYNAATTGSPGGVAINATAISIGNSITNFTITSAGLSLPTASGSVLGGIKVGTGLSIDGSGVLSSSITQYSLPTASGSVLGGIKVGTGLAIDGSGVLSSSITQYSLPTSSTSVLGGVKVDGTSITISSGTISAVLTNPSFAVGTKVYSAASGSYTVAAGVKNIVFYGATSAVVLNLTNLAIDGNIITVSNHGSTTPAITASTANILGRSSTSATSGSTTIIGASITGAVTMVYDATNGYWHVISGYS
jgi:hypothetical protein